MSHSPVTVWFVMLFVNIAISFAVQRWFGDDWTMVRPWLVIVPLGVASQFVLSPTPNNRWLWNLPFTIWITMLKLFYSNLEEAEQQVFLDATTFFYDNRNWTLREANVAWKALHPRDKRPWQNLVWKGFLCDGSEFTFIKLGPTLHCLGRRLFHGLTGGLVWQHLWPSKMIVHETASIKVEERWQDLGRRIAKKSNDSGQCRVWDADTTWKLRTKEQLETWLGKGKEIHVLRLVKGERFVTGEYDSVHIINSTVLPKLKELRFLEANDPVKVDGNVEQNSTPTKLILLKCPGRQIGKEVLFKLHLQTRLVVLKVFDSPASAYLPFGSFHALPTEIGKLSALKVLQFDSCHELQTLTESFGDLKALEHLEFKKCKDLRTLPESFGDLQALNRLIFRNCLNLKVMPGTFRNLQALSDLQFVGCPKLMALPLYFHKLVALTRLRIVTCHALHDLPTSLGKLHKLTDLTIWECKNLKPPSDSLDLKLSPLTRFKYKPYGSSARGRLRKRRFYSFLRLFGAGKYYREYCRC